jgi:hypothetical protein
VTPTASVSAPAPPQSLTAGNPKANATGILLKWTAPVADGGSPIASYFVYRKGPGETTFTLIGLTNASTRTYTDTNVAHRTTYTYAVTAFNTYYESAQSNQVTFRAK